MRDERDALQVERRHLRETIDIAGTQWALAAQEREKHAHTVRAVQEERREQNPIDIGGLHSAQGFLDLLEASQGTMSLSQATSARQRLDRTLAVLARTMETPYFARIDFRPEDGDIRPVYIGRATLMESDSLRIHVYDWRTSIASVFYQYGVGSAQYEAPAGTIRGEVLLKRQYEIRQGELIYFFDADEQVLDAFLRDLLARPASPSMKSIVETIQRDQDRIIRDLTTGLLMVQGAAGSGKTSVALHRVAYLMYQGLQKDRLSPNDILILAPNAAFERYISQVLPDLGEQQVRTMLFEELAGAVLAPARIQPRSAWVEAWLGERDARQKDAMRSARAFKGSRAFIALLDRLIHELPRRWIPFCDVEYDGQCVAHRELLRTEICNATKKAPLGVRLRMLERAIWRRIHERRPARYAKLLQYAGHFPQHATEVQAFARMLSIRESGALARRIRAFTRVDCARLYRALFADRASFARLSRGLLAPEEGEAIRTETLRALSGDTLPYDDAVAVAYLQARIHGLRTYAHIRQLVVDEAQDMDMLHMALLGLLFPNARFTVLGDIHQTLSGQVNPSLYDDMQAALHKQSSLHVTLDKSFRCTREIWDFCMRFLPPQTAVTCFSRSGEAPRIHAAPDGDALDALLIEQALACQSGGCKTVAILCKTAREAQAAFARLKGRTSLALIGSDDMALGQGVFVTSLYMAKGLEFDAVLLYDADAAHYHVPEDKSLLYVACTRALHQLHLFYAGERSLLLPGREEDTQ